MTESEHQIVDLTDEMVAELARKFNVSEAEIREEWAITKALGPDAALRQMDDHVATIETALDEVVEDVGTRWLPAAETLGRTRAMAEFYREGWEVLSADEITPGAVSDLFLKLAVAIYQLAETRAELAKLLDGNHRKGREDG